LKVIVKSSGTVDPVAHLFFLLANPKRRNASTRSRYET